MPVTFEPRSASPTTDDAEACIAGPDLISLEEEPVLVDDDAEGLPDAEIVLSEMPATVEDTPRAPEPLLARTAIESTRLD